MLEKKLKLSALLAGSLSLGFAVAAQAGYTPIAPPYDGEQSTTQILSHTYGDSFVQVGRDFVGSSYTAYRVQDTVTTSNASVFAPSSTPAALNMGLGLPSLDAGNIAGGVSITATDPTDQLWSGNAVIAVARAKFALYGQNFGFFNGSGGGSYHPLLSVSGGEYDVSGTGFMTGLDGGAFRFARNGDNATFTSRNADNPLGIDHMITYQIVYTGNNNAQASNSKVYMLFWDDKLPTDDSDYDFNDMAIEILVTPTNTPEPVSAGLLSLGAIALLRRRHA